MLKFSVVTVVFNAKDVIEKTITSVLNQTYTPYEYLIIDGKSTDGTLDVISSCSKEFEKKGIKLNLSSEKDSGIYNAMNKGIDRATGDFISFLNAGDWYELDALENIEKFYEEEPFDLTYGGLHYINPDGSAINKMSKLDRIVTSRHWNHPSMFLKSEIYKKYHFDESLKICSDFDLFLKLRKSNIKIRVIDKVITNFVADGISTSTDIRNVKRRAKEKYSSYIKNGYSHLYWIECYLWEAFKMLYFKVRS